MNVAGLRAPENIWYKPTHLGMYFLWKLRAEKLPFLVRPFCHGEWGRSQVITRDRVIEWKDMYPNSKNGYVIILCDMYSELVCELVSVELVSVNGLLVSNPLPPNLQFFILFLQKTKFFGGGHRV